MKNSIQDTVNHQFAMLETINDPGLTGERLKEELDRAEAVVDLSQALVSTYRVVIDAQRNMNGGTLHTLPAILGSPMSRKLFTDEQLLFLKNNAEGMTSHELTAAYNLQFGENRSRHTIRSTLSHNGWIGKLRPAGEYTDAQLSYLYANRDKPYTQLVESFNHRFGDNRTANGIKNALERRGWRFNHAGGKRQRKQGAGDLGCWKARPPRCVRVGVCEWASPAVIWGDPPRQRYAQQCDQQFGCCSADCSFNVCESRF